jgi:hypothetical protein
MARNPDLGRNLSIGCFMTPLGFMSGAMVGVLVSKLVAWATNAKCEIADIPTCDWHVYALYGGLVGLTLPVIVLYVLFKSAPPAPPAGSADPTSRT